MAVNTNFNEDLMCQVLSCSKFPTPTPRKMISSTPPTDFILPKINSPSFITSRPKRIQRSLKRCKKLQRSEAPTQSPFKNKLLQEIREKEIRMKEIMRKKEEIKEKKKKIQIKKEEKKIRDNRQRKKQGNQGKCSSLMQVLKNCELLLILKFYRKFVKN